jgi:hypothetical protein
MSQTTTAPPLTDGEFQDWLKAVFADDHKAAELIVHPERVFNSVFRFRNGEVEHVELSQLQRDFMATVLEHVPEDMKERAVRYAKTQELKP